MEIRLRYEYGEDLKDLAIEYKIPLATLNFRKKKSQQNGDEWIKGIKNKQGYEAFVEDEKERKLLLLKKINDEVTNHLDHVEKIIYYYKKEEKEQMDMCETPLLYKSREEAIGKRVETITKIADIKKDIIGVYTPEKQKAIDKLDIELELKRKELEEKELELEIKRKTLELYR